MDIDRFKKINDNYGHDFGDFILKEMASLLKSTVGEENLVGGHKFKKDDEEVTVTVSIGVSNFPEDKVKDKDELIKIANKKLYIAKEGGRNRVEA